MDADEFYKLKENIKNGYFTEELEPIKCTECDSVNFKDKVIDSDGGYPLEKERYCCNCGKARGYWAYGYWQV